jgi:hypothetical protein
MTGLPTLPVTPSIPQGAVAQRLPDWALILLLEQ